jgi:predicted RecA/RadA family phage recombinase
MERYLKRRFRTKTAITHTDASLTSDATIQMRVTDSAGNSSTAVEQTIDVDTEAPKAPELNQVTGDNIINASEAAAGFDITGTGEPGATITLAGPTLAGGNTATVQNDGTWSIPVTKADVTAMGEGNTNLSLTQTDPAGNISPPTMQSITVDTEAPEAPELNKVTGDNIINAREAEDGFDITGTGEPGATITLAGPALAGGNTATVQNDGTWSIPVTKADVTAMGEGNTNLSLTQTDPAGNISDPTAQSITVDALPAILSADMSFGEVLTPDEMDEQADLTVKTANIEDGATISISIDGVSMTPVSATIEANKAVFSASAEELQSLRDGTYEFTLTVTDFPSVQKVQSFKKTGDIGRNRER